MGLSAYFYDTYALVETVQGNPAYTALKSAHVITTKMNLMELHYALLRDLGKEDAEYYYTLFLEFAISISDEVIKEASAFRLANKKKSFSYFDCLGYIIARRTGVKFLTGDNAFKGMENVEFLK